MRRVRCPGCSAIIQATGDRVKCGQCGLSGRVDAPESKPAKAAKDPLQITIDLRKLSPANWGSGGKAFLVLLLVAGAFFAGGFAGIEFEKARSDVIDDLEGNLGTGRSDQTSDTPTDPGSADVGDLPEKTPETIRHDFTGKGRETYTVDVEGGLVRLVMDYNEGSSPGLFKVEFKDADGRHTVVASDLGSYTGVRYLSVPAGTYDLTIGPGATDTGTWTVRVEEPRAEETRGALVSASHGGDWGVGPYTMDGRSSFSFVASESARGPVYVRTFLPDGSQVSGCRINGYTEPTDRVDEQFSCDVDGLVYFDIVHPKDPDGKSWLLKAL